MTDLEVRMLMAFGIAGLDRLSPFTNCNAKSIFDGV
jgi:hypothetical protein